MSKPFFKQVGAQLTAIFIAAFAAAALTFAQSFANQAGWCEVPAADPKAAGTLAAAIKSFHWTISSYGGKMFS